LKRPDFLDKHVFNHIDSTKRDKRTSNELLKDVEYYFFHQSDVCNPHGQNSRKNAHQLRFFVKMNLKKSIADAPHKTEKRFRIYSKFIKKQKNQKFIAIKDARFDNS